MSAVPPSIGSVTVVCSDRRRAAAARDLGAEGEQVVAIGDDRGAVDGGQAGDGVDRAARARPPRAGSLVAGLLDSRSASARERRIQRVGNRRHDRLAPALGVGRDDQQQAAALVRAHRHGELHQDVDRVAPRRRRVEAEQRRQQRRAVGQARGALVHDLDLVRFEHRDVGELEVLAAAVLLDHDAGRAPRLRAPGRTAAACACAPHTDRTPSIRRHAEVDARAARPPARPWPARRARAAARWRTASDAASPPERRRASEIVGT